jgi:hypothetical protein
MTLLELIVALTILALLVTGGGAAFAMVIDRQQTVQNASVDVERAAALRETLRQWILQGAVQVPRGGLPQGGRSGSGARQLASVAPGMGASSASQVGVTAAASTSTANEFTVVTSAPNPLMAPNVRIRVFVDADNTTPEQGLTIEYQGSTPQSPLLRRELDPSVGDMIVEYYDPRTGLWADNASASPAQAIAIRVTMLPADGAALPRMMQLPLTIVYGEATP